ncbi:hydrolase 2, exosortase A system-associated [Rhodoferax sp.]|uniref:hydrolase 2, exosortase A system-associated n=1 Tax=Rhodoferax sp. TaxID=50421 RepID=UPI0027604936|nr:hydrolase 2, exosortase A system-associated [Rhodoferax sp.]
MQGPTCPQPEALFLAAHSVAGGQRLGLFHAPVGGPLRGLVIYLHPFAEEMNKSRRMAALQARALADTGYAVLQIDLLGCGDSSGDFGDASWNDWIDDVELAVQWLRQRMAAPANAPLWLWGLRAGCLLAVNAARHLQVRCNFLFWAPTCSGKTVLQQFLRLKVASDLVGGTGKGVMEGLRQQLAAGTAVDIAGYRLAPSLASALEGCELSPAGLEPMQDSGAQHRRVVWLELSTREDASLTPVAVKTTALWEQAGFALHSNTVRGPGFWQTTEIEDAPALITATCAALAPAKPGEPAQDLLV